MKCSTINIVMIILIALLDDKSTGIEDGRVMPGNMNYATKKACGVLSGVEYGGIY